MKQQCPQWSQCPMLLLCGRLAVFKDNTFVGPVPYSIAPQFRQFLMI